MTPIEARLADLGVTLPDAPAPAANYVPFVTVGTVVYVSGQISQDANGLIKGRLGEDMTLEQGQQAARACAINLITQMKSALGDLERVTRIVKLGGFVNAAGDFTDIPKVVNGCSDLMVEIFGDKGRHARAAVACPVLPMGAAVEVDAVVEFA